MIPVLLTAPYLFEMLAFLAGFILLKKDWPFQFRQLVWMLGLTLLVEMTGTILRSRGIHSNWLYTIFSPVECFSFLFVFFRESAHSVIRKLNKFLLWAVLPVVALAWFFPQSRFSHQQLEHIALLFLQLIGACAMYIDMLWKERGSFFRQPLFWLASGIIIFCFLHILVFSLTHYLLATQDYRFYIWSALGNLYLYGGIATCFFRLDRIRSAGAPAVKAVTKKRPG